MTTPVETATPAEPTPAPVAAAPEVENLAADLAGLQAEATLIDSQPGAAVAAVAAQQQASADQIAAEWAALIVGIGTPAAAILAPNWQIQPAELAALGQAWAPILQEYFPDGVGSMGPWPGAILATAMVVAPRLGLPRHAPPPEETAGDKSNG